MYRKATGTGARVLSLVLTATLLMVQPLACSSSVVTGGDDSDGTTGTLDTGGTNDTSLQAASSVDSCECIAAYGSASMDLAALVKLRETGIPACFHVRNPERLEREAACLPRIVGKHARNERDIALYYFCSDLCPDQGRVGITYAGIEGISSCCAIGGAPILDPGWGGYEACVPQEIIPGNRRVASCAQ